MFSLHHFTKSTALALALALGAFAAPVASATTATYSLQDKQQITTVGAQPRPPVMPNTPYSNRALGIGDTHIAGFGTVAPSTGMGETGAAAAFVAAHHLQAPAQASAAARAPSDSFDWGDAGIGAAGGLVIAMLGVGGGLALSQRRSGRIGTSAVVSG